MDDDNSTLIFSITSEPRCGKIDNIENPGVPITSFTQQEIMDGKIRYVHDGSNTTSDTFVFKVGDGKNELTGQVFNISILLTTQIVPNSRAEKDIMVYPNPSSSTVFVETEMEISNASIYSINGTQVAINMETLENGKLFFNVSSLKKGIYFLVIENKTKSVMRKIIVK